MPDPERLGSLIENYLDETLGQSGTCAECSLPVYGPRQLCARCVLSRDAHWGSDNAEEV